MFGFKDKDKEIIVSEKSYENMELIDECISELKTNNNSILLGIRKGTLSKDTLDEYLKKILSKKNVKADQTDIVIRMVKDELYGYSILNDLLNDDNISDIKIINENNVRIKELGKRKTTDIKFKSKDDVNKYIEKIAIKNKVDTSDSNALPTFMDTESNETARLRITLTMNFVTSEGNSYMHIRKILKKKKSKDELQELGLFTQEQYEYLTECIKNGDVLIFAGHGGSGKTTMMNMLLDELPQQCDGIVIQENEELFSDHPGLMFLKVKKANGEGRISYLLKDLAKQGLLMDIDLFTIGEIKDEEARFFLTAILTGHSAMSSIHGNSSEEAMDKLIDYMKFSSDYSREDLMIMLKNLNAKIIFLKKFKCLDISRLAGYDDEKKCLKYEHIFKDTKRVKGDSSYE